MSDSKLCRKWVVRPCPCGHPNCDSAVIKPGIATLQGSVDRYVAEHIVELHNNWLKEKKTNG